MKRVLLFAAIGAIVGLFPAQAISDWDEWKKCTYDMYSALIEKNTGKAYLVKTTVPYRSFVKDTGRVLTKDGCRKPMNNNFWDLMDAQRTIVQRLRQEKALDPDRWIECKFNQLPGHDQVALKEIGSDYEKYIYPFLEKQDCPVKMPIKVGYFVQQEVFLRYDAGENRRVLGPVAIENMTLETPIGIKDIKDITHQHEDVLKRFQDFSENNPLNLKLELAN